MRFLILLSLLGLSACATPVSPLVKEGHRADYITLDKSDRLITLWEKGQPLKTYQIMSLGPYPVGPKIQEGDGRTPEGHYYINEKHPSARFQKFLNISYPNEQDKYEAAKRGAAPGGFVGIHGDKDQGGLKESKNALLI